MGDMYIVYVKVCSLNLDGLFCLERQIWRKEQTTEQKRQTNKKNRKGQKSNWQGWSARGKRQSVVTPSELTEISNNLYHNLSLKKAYYLYF